MKTIAQLMILAVLGTSLTAGSETKAGTEKPDGAAKGNETNQTAPKTVLSGRNASKELGVFMSERWNRQVWQIECRTALGYTDPRPTWHLKGTMDWVRFVGPEHLKEHLDIDKLDPASTYEITGVPVDYNYGCYSLYILSLPKKVDVSKPAVNVKEQVPSTGGIVGRVLDVPIPHHRQRILHKDAEFEITASNYGAPEAKEIALMVHDVRSDRWAILDSVSTIGATFGYVPIDKIKSCPAPWDFISHTLHEAVPLPLDQSGGPLHFPDLIEDKGSFYAVSHDTSWKDDRMATVLRFDKEALRKIFR